MEMQVYATQLRYWANETVKQLVASFGPDFQMEGRGDNQGSQTHLGWEKTVLDRLSVLPQIKPKQVGAYILSLSVEGAYFSCQVALKDHVTDLFRTIFRSG